MQCKTKQRDSSIGLGERWQIVKDEKEELSRLFPSLLRSQIDESDCRYCKEREKASYGEKGMMEVDGEVNSNHCHSRVHTFERFHFTEDECDELQRVRARARLQ